MTGGFTCSIHAWKVGAYPPPASAPMEGWLCQWEMVASRWKPCSSPKTSWARSQSLRVAFPARVPCKTVEFGQEADVRVRESTLKGIRRWPTAVRDLQIQRLTAVEEDLNVFEGLESLGTEFHDHPPMFPNSRPSPGSSLGGLAGLLQAHVSLDKAAVIHNGPEPWRSAREVAAQRGRPYRSLRFAS